MRRQFPLTLVLAIGIGLAEFAIAQPPKAPSAESPLVPPMLLKKEALEAGNPLATYAAMLELEDRYHNFKPLAGIYDEVRCNFEEFLGFPMAGVKAMGLINKSKPAADATIPAGYEPEAALDVVEREAKKTRIVIWAEEHHLPQTRSLFEPLLRRLWQQGYRYFAAETFTDSVMNARFRHPDYHSGYYTIDPIFAGAMRTAKELGFKLIAYETSERGPDGDASFRDRTQAANIKARVFDGNPDAKVFVVAGRLHASEIVAPDGWTPMAASLKKSTGIDPFTVYAPTMSQRLQREQEHPWYRDADARGLIKQPTIFVNKAIGRTLGFDPCDACVFWPRFEEVDGRPDWMIKTMGRKKVTIPDALRAGRGWRLIQAFGESVPNFAIPADQFLLEQLMPSVS